MVTLFTILMIVVFAKMIGFAIKAAWGLAKIFFGLIFLPAIMIGLAVAGFVGLALPILVIIGIVMLVKRAAVAV